MFFDSLYETDPAWGADPDRLPTEDDVMDDRDRWAPNPPDPLDGVLEVTSMVSHFAAQRFERLDSWRRDVIRDAERHERMSREMVERSLRLELACAMRITEAAATRLLDRAAALVHRYPAALAALGCARITERHADVLVDALDDLEPALRDRIRSQALALAEELPVGTFRRRLHALIERERSDTLAERHSHAVRNRRVVVENVDDGMAWLMALIPAVEARAIHSRLTAIATALDQEDGETRTLDELRADALGDLLVDGRTDAHPPQVRGIRATVTVTVPALTMLGTDAAAAARRGVVAVAEPVTVDGVGPIPIGIARELCAGSDGWMRILTHPETGTVLSVGRERYRPPPDLRRAVTWRAGRCMGPGCGMPADRCELDHTVAWEHGGSTSLDNLAPLCKGHHTVKHHGGWTVRQVPASGGALQWTSPAGRRYVVQPERRMPVFAPDADVVPATAPF